MAPEREEVHHPAHYGGDVPHELIKCMEAWNPVGAYWFCRFNAIKYLHRAGEKPGQGQKDHEKALWYAERAKSIVERFPAVLSEEKAIPGLSLPFPLTATDIGRLVMTIQILMNAVAFDAPKEDIARARHQDLTDTIRVLYAVQEQILQGPASTTKEKHLEDIYAALGISFHSDPFRTIKVLQDIYRTVATTSWLDEVEGIVATLHNVRDSIGQNHVDHRRVERAIEILEAIYHHDPANQP